jgi:hypothetical protein
MIEQGPELDGSAWAEDHGLNRFPLMREMDHAFGEGAEASGFAARALHLGDNYFSFTIS